MISENEVLFQRGQKISSPEEEDASPWDDRVLQKAYDKAYKLAGIRVAQQLAMATNQNHSDSSVVSDAPKVTCEQEVSMENGAEDMPSATAEDVPMKPEALRKHNHKKKMPQFNAGSPCRAVYEEDGKEYEAFVMQMLDNKRCIVRFLGYDNEQEVCLRELRASWGETTRAQQLHCARADLHAPHGAAARAQRAGLGGRAWGSRKRARPRIYPAHSPTSFMRSMPLVPPMPFPPEGLVGLEGEEEQLSSMLLAWYMSGYYTGLYQANRLRGGGGGADC